MDAQFVEYLNGKGITVEEFKTYNGELKAKLIETFERTKTASSSQGILCLK
jgi:hypothetical protein